MLWLCLALTHQVSLLNVDRLAILLVVFFFYTATGSSRLRRCWLVSDQHFLLCFALITVTFFLFLRLTLYQLATEHYFLNSKQSRQYSLLKHPFLKQRQNNIFTPYVYDLILVHPPILNLSL